MGKKKSRCFASLPNPYDWFLKFKNAADLTSKRTNCSNNQKFTCRRKLVNDGFYNSSESAVLSEFSSSNRSPVNINSDISPEQDGSEELINNSLLPLLDENESFKANIDGSSESVNFRRSLSDGCDSPRSSVSSRTLGGGGQQILVNVAGTSLHNGWDSADESTGKSYHLARKHSNGEGNSFQAKDNEEKSAKCTDQRKSWSNSCLRSIEGRNHSRKSFKEPKASETIEVDAINKKNEIFKAEDCGTLTLQFLDKERTDVYYKENRSLKSHGSGTRHRTVNDERAVKKGFYIYVTNGNSQNFSTKEACKNFSFESPGPPIKERSYLASEKGDQRLQQEDRKALRSVNENCVNSSNNFRRSTSKKADQREAKGEPEFGDFQSFEANIQTDEENHVCTIKEDPIHLTEHWKPTRTQSRKVDQRFAEEDIMTTRFTSRRTNKPRVNNQRVQVPPSRKAENLKKSPKVPHQKDQRIKEPPLKREEEFKKCQKLQAVKGKRITDAHSKGTKDINGSPELMAVKNHIIKEPPLEREEGLEGSMIPKVRNNHLTQGTIKGKGVAESEAVVKRTMDAEGDFRESMVEMISQNEIGNPEELEELLASYLYLNPDEYQDVIIRAFRQVWLQVLEISRNN